MFYENNKKSACFKFKSFNISYLTFHFWSTSRWFKRKKKKRKHPGLLHDLCRFLLQDDVFRRLGTTNRNWDTSDLTNWNGKHGKQDMEETHHHHVDMDGIKQQNMEIQPMGILMLYWWDIKPTKWFVWPWASPKFDGFEPRVHHRHSREWWMLPLFSLWDSVGLKSPLNRPYLTGPRAPFSDTQTFVKVLWVSSIENVPWNLQLLGSSCTSLNHQVSYAETCNFILHHGDWTKKSWGYRSHWQIDGFLIHRKVMNLRVARLLDCLRSWGVVSYRQK